MTIYFISCVINPPGMPLGTLVSVSSTSQLKFSGQERKSEIFQFTILSPPTRHPPFCMRNPKCQNCVSVSKSKLISICLRRLGGQHHFVIFYIHALRWSEYLLYFLRRPSSGRFSLFCQVKLMTCLHANCENATLSRIFIHCGGAELGRKLLKRA